MYRHSIIAGLAGLSTLPAAAHTAESGTPQKSDRQPNIVIFLTDDQGAIDLNCFGAKDLCTPNLDRLAASGVRFTRFYANSSVSSPSRASLLTGRDPQRAGVPVIVPPTQPNAGLPASEITLAKVLQEHGYATALIGKWHLGFNPGSLPADHGFGYFFGHRGGCIDNYSHYFYWQGPNRHDLYRNDTEVWREGENFSDLMVEESLAFIDAHRQTPFLLFFSSNYPHYPLQGDAKWRDYYRTTPSPRDKYAAMVSTIDEKIGRVIDKLEAEGLRENTIIVFMSDNGFSREERTFSGGGSAGALRGEKFSVYEGGIRVPAILSYPGHIAENTVCSAIGLGTDWFPTLLELCSLPLPEHRIDGQSLLATIAGRTPAQHRTINWQVAKKWAVYREGYKLVGEITPKQERIELYHLETDMSESNDIASKMPDKVAELRAERQKWLAEMEQK